MHTKNPVLSFVLRMGVVLFALCALVSLGAYTSLRLSADLLLTPGFAMLTLFCYQTEQNLRRPVRRRVVLRVASRQPQPVHRRTDNTVDFFPAAV